MGDNQMVALQEIKQAILAEDYDLALYILDTLLTPSPVEQLQQAYARTYRNRPIIQPKEHGRRSAYDR